MARRHQLQPRLPWLLRRGYRRGYLRVCPFRLRLASPSEGEAQGVWQSRSAAVVVDWGYSLDEKRKDEEGEGERRAGPCHVPRTEKARRWCWAGKAGGTLLRWPEWW